MAVTFAPNFTEIPNVVYPLTEPTATGVTLRVKSGVSSDIGKITILGGGDNKTVSLKGNPLPKWATWGIEGNVVTLKVEAPIQTNQLNNFFLVVIDGPTTSYYGISIDVKPAFTLVTDGVSNNIDIPRFDSAFPNVLLKGRGEGGNVLASNINILPPPNLPKGLNFYSTDGTSGYLAVDQPALVDQTGKLDPSGGMKEEVSSLYPFKAYCPGTMYDNAARPFTLMLNLRSAPPKDGVQQSGLSCKWDQNNKYFAFKMHLDFTQGANVDTEFEWSIPSGNKVAGGGWGDNFLNWAPASDGVVTILCKVVKKGARTIEVCRHSITLSVGKFDSPAEWPSAVRVWFDQTVVSKPIGEEVSVTITANSADLGPSSANVAFQVIDNTGAVLANPPSPVTLTPGNPTAQVKWTPPTSMRLLEKVTLIATATVGTATPKTGKASVVVASTGHPQLTLSGPTTLNQDGPNLKSATYTTTSPSGPIGGCDFSLQNAPAGLVIVNGVLSGVVLTAGSYSFNVVARKEGFASTFLPVTLTVTAPPMLSLNPLTPSQDVVDDGKQFTLSWGLFGNPQEVLIQKNLDYPESVLGKLEYGSHIVGTSTYSLCAQDYRGWVYNKPVVVGSNTGIQVDSLPMAQIVGSIDQNNNLILSWSPVKVGNNYNLYKGWMIRAKAGASEPDVLYSNGVLPTGLEEPGATPDSRKFTAKLKPGQMALDMYAVSSDKTVIGDGPAFPQFLNFPDPLSPSDPKDKVPFSLDKTTASKGESIAISLSPSYRGADSWRVSYSDDRKTDWYPLSIKNVAKAFDTAGQKTILIEVRKEYPEQRLTLMRSYVLGIYIQDQDYNPGVIISSGGLGSIGIGGQAGFEITEAKDGISPSESYEVIVKALVTDSVTQEIKLLVATARTRDASSLKGTMALDVFPIVGRPHMKDLVRPGNALPPPTRTTPVKIKAGATLPDATVGKPIKEFILSAEGGILPYSWYSDNLPAGMQLSIDGTVSGTLLQAGTYSLNFSVKDSSNPASIDQITLLMVAKSDLTITTNSLPDATVGTNYSGTVTVGGGLAPYSFKVASGSLPKGLTIHPTSGAVTGVPCTWNSTTDFDTPWTFTVEVTDSVSSKQSKTITMKLVPMGLSVGDIDQTTISSGMDYRLTVPVFGGRSPYTIVDVTSDGCVADSLRLIGPTGIMALSGKDVEQLTVTSDKTQSQIIKEVAGVSSYPVTFSLSASGGTPGYIWSSDTSGGTTTLPGCVVDPAGTVTGNIPFKTGDPTSRDYQVVVKVTDSAGKTALAVIKLSVMVVPLAAKTYTTKLVALYKKIGSDPADPVWEVGEGYGSLPSWVWGNPYKPATGSGLGESAYAIIPTDTAGLIQVASGCLGHVTGPSVPNGRINIAGATPGMMYGMLFNVVSGLVYDKVTGQNVRTHVVMISGTPNAGSASVSGGSNLIGVSFTIPNASPASGDYSLPSPGFTPTSDPVFSSTPNLVLRYTKTIRSSGQPSYNITSSSSIPLSAINGTAPYTFTKEPSNDPAVRGFYVDKNGTNLVWNPACTSDVYLKGSGVYVVRLKVTDALGREGFGNFSLSVTEEVVNEASLSLTSAVLSGAAIAERYPVWPTPGPACCEVGGRLGLYFVPTSPVKYTKTTGSDGSTYDQQDGNPVNLPRGTTEGKVNYTTVFVGTNGASTRLTYSIDWYTKSVTIRKLTPELAVGQSYSVASGTSPVEVIFDGYLEADPWKYTVVTTTPSYSKGTNVTPSIPVGTKPKFVFRYDFDAAALSAPGNLTITAEDPSKGLKVTDTIPIKGSGMKVVGNTLDITVSAREVIPGSGKQIFKSFPYPITVTGNQGDWKAHWTGTNSTQWSFVQDDGPKAFKVNFTNSNMKAGESYKMQIHCDVSDSFKTEKNVIGWINLTVAKPTQLNLKPSNFNIPWPAKGGYTAVPVYNFMELVDGTTPLQLECLSVSLPPEIASRSVVSPRKWSFWVNNTGSPISIAEQMGSGDPVAFAIGDIRSIPAILSDPPSGTYQCSATLKLTDANGLMATQTFPFSITVP